MNRIELVEETLKELFARTQSGVTAAQLAYEINADRSNVSRDLNTLVKNGKSFKKKSRPVLFYPLEGTTEATETIDVLPSAENDITNNGTYLDFFASINPSLFHQIELGKSAILYPSHVMHVLILGETGVGKSMFAELLHDYGVEAGKFAEKAPFIRFNCADYASNPQLLLAQLFGNTKGAYTGADVQKVGLIKQADKGILFLDEIHRLPMEGQEMLFTFMDQGTFKPLGETVKEHRAEVMIIGATTESKESLLSTFTRRIPIVLELPPLQLRTIEERFQLFTTFTKAEVDKLGIKVKISTNSIRAFLSYECRNNIGQLKTDIRIVFAKAYADYLTGKKAQLVISTADLPVYIQEGLLSGIEHRKMWSILDNYHDRFYDYFPQVKGDSEVPVSASQSIYTEINQIFNRLESKNLSVDAIQKEIENDLAEYIKQHQKHHAEVSDYETLMSFIPEEILGVIEEMIQFSEGLLKAKLSGKVHQALAIHMFNVIERINTYHTLSYEDEYKLSHEFPALFDVATQAIRFMEKRLNMKIPQEEANFLVLFFSYDELNRQQITDNVQVIVIAHGKNTATALSETANSLLRNKSVIGINARLDEKPQDVYNELKAYIKENKITQDVLLLVDMGSLMTFATNLEEEFALKSLAVPLVSTMHVLEASRKAMLGYSLAEVYQETLNVNSYLDSILKAHNQGKELIVPAAKMPVMTEEYQPKPLAVLSICMTGEGTALTIQKMLEKKLLLKDKGIDILPINLVGKESIQSRIKQLEERYRVICLVSTFSFETKIPNFDLFNVMNEKGLVEIETIIQEELTYRQMTETINEYYDITDLPNIVHKVFAFNDKMELLLNTRFNSSELIGLSFHIIGMIIKDHHHQAITDFVDNDQVLANNLKFVNRIQQAFTQMFDSYFVNLNKNQLNYVAYNYLSIRH